MKNVMMVHEVQQFHQNSFSAPDDGCVGHCVSRTNKMKE
jgi:hypothetical protein